MKLLYFFLSLFITWLLACNQQGTQDSTQLETKNETITCPPGTSKLDIKNRAANWYEGC